MEAIKKMILMPWDFMRLLRLGVGLYAATQAYVSSDMMLAFLSAFFLVQAVTNTGCCGTQSCASSTDSVAIDEVKDITFEEIKTK